MDTIPPRNVNEIDPDLNRIENLSLEGQNQKLILEAEEFKNRFKESFLTNFGGKPSLTAPCLCGGPMSHPERSDNAWNFPEQKLYSAAEGPTRKSWSPLAPPSPRKCTLHSTSNMQKDDANSN